MIHCREFDFSKVDFCGLVKKGKIKYYNCPISFDIETTSFKDYRFVGKTKKSQQGIKRACMYIWQMCINGVSVFGRTWSQLIWFLGELRMKLSLSPEQKVVIYVHNLSYEFHFLMGHIPITNVFARKKHKPMKCDLYGCIELRCSYFLSGLSLAKTAENLTNHKLEKKIGELDYTKIRHYKTPLTKEEMEYCEYDVLIVWAFIAEEITKNGDITKIPLTKTGYVRKYCRDKIRESCNYKTYRKMIQEETIIEPEIFILLNKTFAGGYTHANILFANVELEDIGSYDFTSHYPTQMLAHKFPRSKFTKINIKKYSEFKYYTSYCACIFNITLFDVKSKSSHHIWSLSKCEKTTDEIVDNGRIASCSSLSTFMTDVDWKIFKQFYKFNKSKIIIHSFYYASYGYLPKPLLECVLDFYVQKTTLKGVEHKEDEYLVSKGMLNGIYGMMVTNPLNDEILYDDTFSNVEKIWATETPDIQSALQANYDNGNQFLCYQWGVWITAWARYELLSTVYKLKDDVVYCDTDSIKLKNPLKNEKIFDDYNEKLKTKLISACNRNGIDTTKLNPQDIKGNNHFLGLWEYEGSYSKFKTLGAKRYCFEKDNEFHITISGLTNNTEIENNPTEYILKNGGFEYFKDDMKIPKEYSHRLTHTYCFGEYNYELTDYQGNTATVSETSYIHMEPAEFNLGLAPEFVDFLLDAEFDARNGRTKRRELAIRWSDLEFTEENFPDAFTVNYQKEDYNCLNIIH